MNNPEEIKDDILRQYMGPEKAEKAAQGFTANIMSRIQVETAPERRVATSVHKSRIPVLSFIVTLVFIAGVMFIGNGKEETLNPVSDFISSLKITFPVFEFPEMGQLAIPGWFPYILISILLLAAFDRSLFRLFHKEK